MIATSVIPGIAWTWAMLSTASADALMVGGRHNIVGSAPAVFRSIANCFRPVTMSTASILRWAVPISVNCEAGFSCVGTATVLETAARWASSPIVAALPPGATICPFWTLR